LPPDFISGRSLSILRSYAQADIPIARNYPLMALSDIGETAINVAIGGKADIG
jgi:hypothetical protein